MGKLKLDKIDKKILSFIFHDFRQPLTKVAKKCRISREQVEYRIKKYEKNGLIRKYMTLYNLSLLDYSKLYHLKLKVKNSTLERLANLPNTDNNLMITKVHCYGAWDYVMMIYSKSKMDFLNFISNLYEQLGSDIFDYDIFEPIESSFYPLKIFGTNENDKTLSFKECDKKVELDELDRKIMSILSDRANMKIVDIARELDEKIETVSYRIKKIEKNIIVGYRLFLESKVLGYSITIFSLKLNDLSEKNIKKLRNYGNFEKKIHGFSLGIGKHNVHFQIVYEHPYELNAEINKIKNMFADSIIEYELTHVEHELDPKTSPY